MGTKVAILGTRGIPAKYGGFETFADEISSRLVQDGFEVTVYCEAADTQPEQHQGVDLSYVAAPHLGPLTTVGYDLLCLWRARKGFHVVYMLGYGASIFCFLPRLWGTQVWINMDGLEWKRRKWSFMARSYLHIMEGIATWVPSRIIADAEAIRVDLRSRYATRAPCDVIPYGCEVLTSAPEVNTLQQWELQAGQYYLVVCRFEPENHVAEMIEGFLLSNSERSLVLIGNSKASTPYVCGLLKHRGTRVKFLGTLYDRSQLRSLRYHCKAFLHGYSVGGTPLSLLEAMGCSNLVIAHDNTFSREVLDDAGLYFTNPQDMSEVIAAVDSGMVDEEARKEQTRARALDYYNWPRIMSAYKSLLSSAPHSRMEERNFGPGRSVDFQWARPQSLDIEGAMIISGTPQGRERSSAETLAKR